MTTVLFVRLTASIEDAHAIAVEGQANGLAVDEQRALLSHLANQHARQQRLCRQIALVLQGEAV